MPKEALKKEAIKYAVDYPTSYGKGYKHKDLRIAYLAGAEPREKRIAELEEENRALVSGQQLLKETLEKENAELEKENAELKAQIEKMKCCENCGWYYLQQHWRESEEINESRMFHCGTCGNKKNWKLKEIKEK